MQQLSEPFLHIVLSTTVTAHNNYAYCSLDSKLRKRLIDLVSPNSVEEMSFLASIQQSSPNYDDNHYYHTGILLPYVAWLLWQSARYHSAILETDLSLLVKRIIWVIGEWWIPNLSHARYLFCLAMLHTESACALEHDQFCSLNLNWDSCGILSSAPRPL